MENTPEIFLVTKLASRLDVFLSEQISGLSRRKARELCEAEKVLVNGDAARSGRSLKIGDEVRLLEAWQEVSTRPELVKNSLHQQAVRVHYEDDAILVIEKPRAMSSVRLRTEDPVTVADWVSAHCAACATASPDAREAGLVQRLDFFTSGLMLAAKSREAWEALRGQLFSEQIEKSYLALVEKRPVKPKFSISLPLTQSKDGKSMIVVRDQGEKQAVPLTAATEVRVLGEHAEKGKGYAFVRARGRRVRRHQIRAHLAAAGHALVGDTLYGAKSMLADILKEPLQGFLLHAERISLIHPLKDEGLDFVCSSPLCDFVSEKFVEPK